MNNANWVVEERMALVPVIGDLLKSSLPEHDVHEEKVTFGAHLNQYFYLCWPKDPALRRRSAVLFVHGGGWSTGNAFLYRFVGHFFAGLGYPTILGGYRLAPRAHFPAQIEDATAGLELGVQALLARGVKIERVIVGGHSAGGELAGLLVYDPARCIRVRIAPAALAGFFAISSPLDFSACTNPALQKMIVDYLGKNPRRDLADPIGLIRGDESVPAFFIHGDRDPLVDLENTLSFAGRLMRSRTCPVWVHLVHGGHHADLAALFLRDLQPTRAFARWLADCDRP
jgi:acetyl esterase/lipase